MTRPGRRPVRNVAIVVPAADEQDAIAACLGTIDDAVRHARLSRPGMTAQVVVVLDRCLDGTAEIVASRPGVEAVVSTAGNVGLARDQGSRWAIAHSCAPPASTWTAHTDADSLVPTDWLEHQLDLADDGACVVLGTVLPDVEQALLGAWSARHSSGDGHQHVHGANLGIRADVLRDVGGWGPQAVHEDVNLVARVLAAGHDIRRTGGAVVTTSGRLTGRTRGGFAGYLRDLAVAGES